MKNQFPTRLFGYSKKEVDRHMEFLKKDYEDELRKKKDRILELAEENRRLKQENQDQKDIIEKFNEQERYISRALIEAEQQAQSIVEEGKRIYNEEYNQLKAEKERWKEKFRDVRNELLAFEQSVLEVIERFRDEINYYTAKEISESILMNDEDSDDSNMPDFSRLNESEAAVADEVNDKAMYNEEMLKLDDVVDMVKIDDKKRKVIA